MFLDEETRKDSYKLLGQYIAFFSIPSQPGDGRLWQWYNQPNGLCIMMRPHRNPETRGCYLSITMPARGQRDPVIEAAMEKGPNPTKRMLHDYYKDAGWEAERVLKGMDACDDFYMARAAQVKLPKWTNGRAVAIGDAAHATFGIGTSLAIEGAYFLAGAISKMESSEQVQEALLDFEETYRTHYGPQDNTLPGYPQLFFPQTNWALFMQRAFLWFVSTTKIYKLLPRDQTATFSIPTYEWTKV